MTARELIRKARAFYPNSKVLQRRWVLVQLRYALAPKVPMGLGNTEQLHLRERPWA